MNRHQRRAAGKKQRTASGAGAMSAAALCELGHRHLQAGRTLDAQLCCQQALAMDSGFADALHLMGQLSLRTEQADHAIEWFSRAVQRDPKPAYLLSLGNTLRRQGRLEEAFRPLDRAVEIDIESAEAWKALAGLLADLKRHNEAMLSFQHVLKLDPRDGDAAYQAGLLLFQSGKPEDALALLDRSDQLQPNHAPTAQMRGLVLQILGRVEEAHVEMCRAHALDPDEADTCNNMGVFLRKLGRPEEALTWFDKALKPAAGLYGRAWQQGLHARKPASLRRGACDLCRGEGCKSRQYGDGLERGASAAPDRKFRSWLGRARGAVERAGPADRQIQLRAADVARKGTDQRQDDPDPSG